MSVTKRQWLRELQQSQLPAGQRIMRGTLMCLPVSPMGDVTGNDDDLSYATGLPRRTIARHLSKAVESGWLEKVARGGNGNRTRYRIAIPSEPLMTNECAINGIGSVPQSTHSGPSGVSHLVANINKESANVSEHKALDLQPPTNIDHNVTHAEPENDTTKDAAKRTTNQVLAIDAAKHWCCNVCDYLQYRDVNALACDVHRTLEIA